MACSAPPAQFKTRRASGNVQDSFCGAFKAAVGGVELAELMNLPFAISSFTFPNPFPSPASTPPRAAASPSTTTHSLLRTSAAPTAAAAAGTPLDPSFHPHDLSCETVLIISSSSSEGAVHANRNSSTHVISPSSQDKSYILFFSSLALCCRVGPPNGNISRYRIPIGRHRFLFLFPFSYLGL